MCHYSSHLINRCLELSLDLLGLKWQEQIFKLRRLRAVPFQSRDHIYYWVVYIYFNWFLPLMDGITRTCLEKQKIWSFPPFRPAFLAGIFCLAQFAQSCKQSEGLLRVFTFLRWYILHFMRSRAVKKFLSSRLIMNSRGTSELTPKAQVLEGRGI